jgi:tRNA threonylcarbamoyladenosine biosynthesis protein TsaB
MSASPPAVLPVPSLAIETAGSACSVAMRVSADHPPAHEVMATAHGHATALAPMIARMSQASGVDLRALKAIAVSCGPGGFTGIRVGLATARALALAVGCPVVGIGSFQALAATAAQSGGRLGPRNLVVLDSRRSELFAVVLGPDLQPLSTAELLTSDEVEARCRTGNIALIADAALTQFAALGGLSASADALAVAELAATRPDLHRAAEPIYLRPPDISQPRPRKP